GNFGNALGRINSQNISNAVGSVGQTIGESYPAMAGAALAIPGGAATGAAALGPWGALAGPPGVAVMSALGAIGGGALAGAGGAGLGSVIDAGTRQVARHIEKAAGYDTPGSLIPGANSYDKAGDLSHQVMGDMLFGLNQGAADGFLKASVNGVGKGALNIFAKTIEDAGYSAERKSNVASMINGFGGMETGYARNWADNPMEIKDLIPKW